MKKDKKPFGALLEIALIASGPVLRIAARVQHQDSVLPGSRGQPRELACSGCGYLYRDFKRCRFLGCPQCYQDFAFHLRGYLKRMHGTLHHRGRRPGPCTRRSVSTRRGRIPGRPR